MIGILRIIDRSISKYSVRIYLSIALVSTLGVFSPFILQFYPSMENTVYRDIYQNSRTFKIGVFATLVVIFPIYMDLFFDCFGSIPRKYLIERAILLLEVLPNISYFVFPDIPFLFVTLNNFIVVITIAVLCNAASTSLCINPKLNLQDRKSVV